MQEILQIAQRDIRLEFSSPMAWLFFLVLPLMFTGIFAGQFSSGDGDNPNPGVQLLIVDQDRSELSADLINKLDVSNATRIEAVSLAEADEQFSDG